MVKTNFTRTLRPRTSTSYNNDRTHLPRDSEIPYLHNPSKTPEQEAQDSTRAMYYAKQDIQFALRHIATSPLLPNELRKHPILNHMRGIACAFQLTLQETTFWALLLEKYVWKYPTYKVRQRMAFAAYAAKDSLNSNIPPVSIPQFMEMYRNWMQMEKIEFSFSPKTINSKFTDLCALPTDKIIDYNFIVDEILEEYTTHTEEEDTVQPMQVLNPIQPAVSMSQGPPMDVEREFKQQEEVHDNYDGPTMDDEFLTPNMLYAGNYFDYFLPLEHGNSSELENQREGDGYIPLGRSDSLVTSLFSKF